MIPGIWLAAIFIGIPLLEIYLFIVIGGAIGAIPSIFLVVFSGVLGALLIRHQGVYTLRRVQESMARGEVPALVMLEGMLIFVSGVLLLTPGFFTDSIGILLLIPPVRKLLVHRMLGLPWFRPPGGGPTGGSSGQGNGPRTIEGEFHRED